MIKNDSETGLGNVSLTILFLLIVSTFAFFALNLPNNGKLADADRTKYGVNKNNLFPGLLTSNIIHNDTNHFIQNLFACFMILYLALVCEQQSQRIRKINIVYWFFLPLIAADSLLLVFHGWLNAINPQFNPYSTGLSLFISFSLGFLLASLEYRKYFSDLGKPSFSYGKAIQVVFAVLFAFFVLSLFVEVFNAAFSNQLSALLSELAHDVALAIGLLFGTLNRRKEGLTNFFQKGFRRLPC